MIPRSVAASRRPNPRIRVLNLARDAGYEQLGGAETLVYDIVRGLDRERFDSYLCTTRAPAPYLLATAACEVARLRAEGIHVLTLDRRSSKLLLPWQRLWALMRRERIDILHAHMPRAAVPGAVLARGAGVPVVIAHEHGTDYYGHWLRKLLDRQVVSRLSDVVFTPSEWDRRNLIDNGHMPAERVTVFRNGISAPAPSDAPGVRDELAAPGQPLVGAVGRLIPVKGYSDLIEAVHRLRAQGLQVRCVIAGTGPAEARLRDLIAGLELEESVTLLGFRSDVADLLRALDVLVMPSHREAAPLALIEAMAAGCPIVATRVGGLPELIDDGVSGLLVPPGAPDTLAAGIARLINEPGLGRRLGQAAQRRQRAELSVEAMLGHLQDIYLDLYQHATDRGRPSIR
jgi:glycosyltransferase involved in cell wall biosynthesis